MLLDEFRHGLVGSQDAEVVHVRALLARDGTTLVRRVGTGRKHQVEHGQGVTEPGVRELGVQPP